jgi:hypothetical protein
MFYQVKIPLFIPYSLANTSEQGYFVIKFSFIFSFLKVCAPLLIGVQRSSVECSAAHRLLGSSVWYSEAQWGTA